MASNKTAAATTTTASSTTTAPTRSTAETSAATSAAKKPTDSTPMWKKVMKQEGVDDMTMLAKVTHEQIVENLKRRYISDIIYTTIGDVLVSVNPYKTLPIYNTTIAHEYHGKSTYELPPHIFTIAESAYNNLKVHNESQCVLITGESGSGKTESAKFVLQYLADITGAANEHIHNIKKVLLDSNPLLEAFGNAKTLHNNNSSRFGKYFEVSFENAQPAGGRVVTYLLEKSRVVKQITGERSFHFFYQLCAGAPDDLRKDFSIQTATSYKYLSNGDCIEVPGLDDKAGYENTVTAMKSMGITDEEYRNIVQLVSSILWLGNLELEEGEEGCRIKDSSVPVLEKISTLLQVPKQFLSASLTFKLMETSHGAHRGTTYSIPLHLAQGISGRDGLAKAIYSALFDWLVARVNKALTTTSKGPVIGILDIYGFEVFPTNLFEQLCINYVNEKLQHIFINFTLFREQEEYKQEGIRWNDVEYFDNKAVCELIEGKRGIFSVLDDVCKTSQVEDTSSNQAVVQGLQGSCSGNKYFDLRTTNFLIRHYAGSVNYSTTGMAETNKDTLVRDLFEVVQTSTNQYLLELFPYDAVNDKKLSRTAAQKIKASCADLVKVLSACSPHYVRCLKPNDNKLPDEYNSSIISTQTKYLGLLDNLKVRRAGYAYRAPYSRFLERYYLCCPQMCKNAKIAWTGDAKSGCKTIMTECGITTSEYALGHTKIFVQSPETITEMDTLREHFWRNMAFRVVQFSRNYNKFLESSATAIQKAYSEWKEYAPFLIFRLQSEALFKNKKERKRMSMISFRQYYGDYLDINTNEALKTLLFKHYPHPQAVVFSSKCSVVAHNGILHEAVLSPRMIILTKKFLYLIKVTREKNLIEHKQDRVILLSQLRLVSLSPLADPFIVITVPNDYDCVLCCDFNTELASHLYQISGSPLCFSEKIEYKRKGGSKAVLSFERLDSPIDQPYLFKKGTVSVPTGLPADSVPLDASQEEQNKTGKVDEAADALQDESSSSSSEDSDNDRADNGASTPTRPSLTASEREESPIISHTSTQRHHNRHHRHQHHHRHHHHQQRHHGHHSSTAAADPSPPPPPFPPPSTATVTITPSSPVLSSSPVQTSHTPAHIAAHPVAHNKTPSSDSNSNSTPPTQHHAASPQTTFTPHPPSQPPSSAAPGTWHTQRVPGQRPSIHSVFTPEQSNTPTSSSSSAAAHGTGSSSTHSASNSDSTSPSPSATTSSRSSTATSSNPPTNSTPEPPPRGKPAQIPVSPTTGTASVRSRTYLSSHH
ncbi:myosin IC [Pelomyxa schiedti]|nr:myosin IC [Pelomyxa schiedti]